MIIPALEVLVAARDNLLAYRLFPIARDLIFLDFK
jgi:hypothetical protein